MSNEARESAADRNAFQPDHDEWRIEVSSNNRPAQVIIIRHGEKVGDPKKDNDGGRHLSIRGSARAAGLPSLFVAALPQPSCKLSHKDEEFIGAYRPIPTKGNTPRFPTPSCLFATQTSKDSNRPIETVTPLATALGIHIDDDYADDDKDINTMTNAILTESAFAGKTVLVCWHHGNIPNIAKALGISKPPKWDGKVFDRVWQITFPKGKAMLQDSPQMLLYGDSAK
jgi:phosphohistidine phosphatase SixA